MVAETSRKNRSSANIKWHLAVTIVGESLFSVREEKTLAREGKEKDDTVTTRWTLTSCLLARIPLYICSP